MEPGSLRKVAVTSAAEVCEKFDLSETARPLLASGMKTGAFLSALMEGESWPDAIRFLAFALPRREAVWWSCIAARASLAPKPPDAVQDCLRAAEEWVYRPTDENRRAVFPLAEAIGFDSPAAYAGLAAYWSGGSIAPPDQPEVKPDEKLCPSMVAAAVLLSAVLHEPRKAPLKYRALLASGVDIANGGNGKLEKEL